MPIEGWDHIELWVGNAKQSAYFYEHAFGFTPVAYAGPETGVRDRASYVLEQGHIRLVVTSGLRADSDIARFCHAHGDGVKDVALTVPDATEAYRQAVQRGGVSVAEPHWVEDEHGRVELATMLSPDEREALRGRLADRVRELLVFTPNVVFLDPGAMPRSEMKTRRLVREYDERRA